MPLFDFECQHCGKINEQLVMGREIPECPDCGSIQLTKLIGAPAPPGKSKELIARARRRASSAGKLG